MVYHHVMVHPTEGQMSDLSMGEEVKLSHHHLKGDVQLIFTTAQCRKLERALAAGKGCTLKFSAQQLKYHAAHGVGVFAEGVRSGKGILGSAARWLGKAAVDGLVDWTGLGVAPKEGKGFVGDAARWLGKTAVDGLVAVSGLGVKPKKKKTGKGLF